MKGDLELAIRHLKNEYHFSFESDQMKAADGAESELAALREAVNEARVQLQSVKDHHIKLNNRHGRPIADSYTIQLCDAWLAAHPAEDVKK